MQRVLSRGRRVTAMLAVVVAVAASALQAAGVDGSARSASVNAPAHLCPPTC